MTIAFDDLFTRLGKIGHIGYMLAGDQAALPATITDVLALYEGTSDVNLIGALATNQAQTITPVVTPAETVASIATTTLVAMVNADVPSVSNVSAAMNELIRQMVVNSESVAECTVSVSSSALSTNIGTGIVVTSVKRGNGLIQQNIVPEVCRVTCTADSYTGGTQPGQEQFTLTGQPNTVGIWNYNYPQGSASSSSVTVINPSSSPSAIGNQLTNSDFEDWSGALSTDTLDNWTLQSGAYGTDIQQSATAFTGTKSVQFLPTATAVNLYQEFGDGTTGTSITPTPLTSYPLAFWMRTVSGTASAGVLTVELVDDTSTVINDEQGVANSFTVDLTTLTTAWASFAGVFRIPNVPPSVMRIRFRMSTLLSGASVLLDQLAMGTFSAAYAGGFGFAVFAGDEPFVQGDGFNTTATNDWASSTYLATFQALFNRFFNMSSMNLLLPYSGTPTQLDTLITA